MRATTDRQPELPEWLRPLAQRLSPFIKWLVIAETLAFLVYLTAPPLRDFIASNLALGPGMAAGKFWQPVTALAVHVDILSLAFNVLGIWFVGSAMEMALGYRRFLLVFFAPALVGHVAHGLASAFFGNVFVYGGCGLPVLAIFVAFGVHYDQTPARVLGRLVLPARTLAAILVGFSVALQVMTRAWPALAGSLVAVLMSYVVCGGKGEPLPAPLPARPSGPRVQMQVIEGGKGKTDPRYLN